MIERLIEVSLHNRLLATAAAILVGVLGVLAYRGLAIDVFPDPSPTLVQIFTDAEGLAPEEMERLVSYPVESAVLGLPRVREVRSLSAYGLSIVSVYFEDGTDIYWARQLVAPTLSEIGDALPPQAHEPELGPIATGLGLVYLYYLEGDGYSPMELRTLQDWIVKYELKALPEVSQVLSIGGDVKQFQILVDPKALLKYNLTISDLVEKVRSSNRNAGASFITRGKQEYIVRSIGLAEDLQDLEQVVIAVRDGTPVYLSAVARVETLPAIKRGTALEGGTGEKVVGMVLKLFGSNTPRVIDRIESRIAEVQQALPEGVRIVPFYNQAALVRRCFTTVSTNLALGVLLVVAILFLLMGDVRPALLAMLSLPFSIMVAFILMNRMGLAADLMSFGGLAIAIGLIADASIILVENASRRLAIEGGGDRLALVLAAGREVARPLFFAITIIILVFLPIFTLTGVEGIMFRPMGYAISFALAGSLLFAMLILPAVSYFVLRPSSRPGRETLLMRRLRALYTPLFGSCRRHPGRVFAVTLAVMLFGLLLIPFMGREYMPTLEEGTLHVRVTLNPNISLEESSSVATRVEQLLLGLPEVTGVLSRIGRGETGSHAHFVNDVEVLVQLAEPDRLSNARDMGALEQAIRERLTGLPGLTLNITQPIAHNLDELVTGVKAQLAARLYGDDLGELERLSGAIAEVIEQVRGSTDVQVEQFANQDHVRIDLDRARIARYGLEIAGIQETIEAAIGGVTIGEVYDGQRRFDIFLRFQPSSRADVGNIEDLLIPLPSGGRIPLQQVAEVKIVQGPRLVLRENGRRYATVQCNVSGRDIGSFVAEARQRIERQVDLPAGYLLKWGGEFELHNRANARLTLITPITFILVALLLFTAFNTMRDVIVILLVLPLALSGGVIALWLGGLYLSVPASIGFIAIFGIALEAGLVLVSRFKKDREEGIELTQAVTNGVQVKLRPVLMTTFTTVLGILPLLLATGPGAEIQRPLATVVVGGLISSTLVTLVVLPLVYESVWRRIPNQSSGS